MKNIMILNYLALDIFALIPIIAKDILNEVVHVKKVFLLIEVIKIVSN